MQTIERTNLRQRVLDEVEYWRAQAGWSDGDYDESSGYSGSSGSSSGSSSSTSSSSSSAYNTEGDVFKILLKICCIIVALGLSVLMYRALTRRTLVSDKDRKSRSDKSSKSHKRSSSLRRSRSRSRSRRGEYDLMQDDGESRRSGRSRSSRSRRGRSRSRTERSRSKSKSRAEKENPAEPQQEQQTPPVVQEAVLV